MQYDVKSGKLQFASGRKTYANCSIVGLPAAGDIDAAKPTEGYDGGISIAGEFEPEGLTSADCVELADHMISRWTAWRELRRG